MLEKTRNNCINGVRKPELTYETYKNKEDYEEWYLQNKKYLRELHKELNKIKDNEFFMSVVEYFDYLNWSRFDLKDNGKEKTIWDE